MENLDLYYDHMSAEGSLAFHCNECHAYSMCGSIIAGFKPALPRTMTTTLTAWGTGKWLHEQTASGQADGPSRERGPGSA